MVVQLDTLGHRFLPFPPSALASFSSPERIEVDGSLEVDGDIQKGVAPYALFAAAWTLVLSASSSVDIGDVVYGLHDGPSRLRTFSVRDAKTCMSRAEFVQAAHNIMMGYQCSGKTLHFTKISI